MSNNSSINKKSISNDYKCIHIRENIIKEKNSRRGLIGMSEEDIQKLLDKKFEEIFGGNDSNVDADV